jgi:pyroglutamyl-peptidase
LRNAVKLPIAFMNHSNKAAYAMWSINARRILAMAISLLLTTFAPWRAHQHSNASEDLVARLQQQQRLPRGTVVINQLPVSFELAHCHVIAKMIELQPRVVVCCGMAEERTHLNLEVNGKQGDRLLKTGLNLPRLMADTRLTAISHCAGDYVCNHLYHQVLDAIKRHHWQTQALFVHIPPLSTATEPFLLEDFTLILKRLATEVSSPPRQLAAA